MVFLLWEWKKTKKKKITRGKCHVNSNRTRKIGHSAKQRKDRCFSGWRSPKESQCELCTTKEAEATAKTKTKSGNTFAICLFPDDCTYKAIALLSICKECAFHRKPFSNCLHFSWRCNSFSHTFTHTTHTHASSLFFKLARCSNPFERHILSFLLLCEANKKMLWIENMFQCIHFWFMDFEIVQFL